MGGTSTDASQSQTEAELKQNCPLGGPPCGMEANGAEVLSVHDIDSSTQPWLGITGVGEPSLSGVESGVEHTAVGTRGMPLL